MFATPHRGQEGGEHKKKEGVKYQLQLPTFWRSMLHAA
jgi:hypothetical protein